MFVISYYVNIFFPSSWLELESFNLFTLSSNQRNYQTIWKIKLDIYS